MELRRQKVRNQVLGPRALAVISCALALLAAQPTMGTGRRGGEAAASVKVAGGTEFRIVNGELGMGVRREGQDKQTARQEIAAFAASPRLHVLATVEMLGRLLAWELRPMEGRVVAALALEAMPSTVELVLVPPYRVSAVDERQIPISHEQRFAIEHSLLAPPVA